MTGQGSLRAAGLLTLLLCLGATHATVAADTLGLWFDTAATVDTLRTTAAQESVTINLILRDPSARFRVSGWECAIDVQGAGAGPITWTVREGLNVDHAPNFQVGITTQGGLPVAPAMLLATGRITVASPDSTIRIYLRPYPRPSLEVPPGSGFGVAAPIYAADGDPHDLRPLALPRASAALPVAVINPRPTGPLRSIAPASLTFGLVPLHDYRDRGFDIANVGLGVLTGYVAPLYGADFRIIDSGKGHYQLGPGEVRRFTVRFQPLAVGEQRATVPDAGDLRLSGTGFVPGICALDSTRLAFGDVPVGRRPRLSLRVRNDAASPVIGEVPAACGPFTVIEGAGAFLLTQGSERVVTVEFAPLTPGTASCALEFGATCGGVTVTGTGIDAPPRCEVSPTALYFDSVDLGQSTDAVLTITNGGGGLLAGECALASATGDCAQFAIVDGAGPYSLPTGQSHGVTVRFTPTMPGQHSCTLATGLAGCGQVGLSGAAYANECQVWPAQVTLSDTPVGATTYASIQVRNIGHLALHVAPRVTGSGFAPYGDWDRILPPGTLTGFTLAFVPTTAGDFYGEVLLGGPCGLVTVQGRAFVTQPCRPQPAALDFGTLADGSRVLSTTIRNDNQVPLTASVLIQPSTTDFSIPNPPAPASVPPGGDFTVNVRYDPRSLGRQDAVLRIRGLCDDDSVPLTGYASDLSPRCSLEPDTLDFGLVPVGASSSRSLIIRNAGGHLVEGAVLSPTADGVSITDGAGPYSLAAGQSHEASLRFAPAIPGPLFSSLPLLSSTCGNPPLRGFGTSPGHDIVTVSFSPSDLTRTTHTTTAPLERVTAFVIVDALSLANPYVVHWELGIDVLGDITTPVWTSPGLYFGTVGASQNFVIDGPWLGGTRVLLASFTFLQLDPHQPTRILLRPPTGGNFLHYATVQGQNATGWRALLPSSGAWDRPVAVVNRALVGVTAPTPIAFVTDGDVRLSWPCGEQPGDRFDVWRRAGDGAARRLNDAPLACSAAGCEFVDRPEDAARTLTLRYRCAVLRDGIEIARSAEMEVAPLAMAPSVTALHPVFPNPFNPQATVRFDLARAGHARVTVFDLAGRRVRTLCDEDLPAGSYTRVWDGRNDSSQPLPSGSYYARLAAKGANVIRKMALIR